MSTDSAPRIIVVCKFIEGLRDLKTMYRLSPDELKKTAESWEVLISGIGTQFLRGRSEKSLFHAAAANGLTEAAQIWELWIATTGGQQVAEQQRQARHDHYRELASEPETMGPARREMLDFLYANGITETMLGGAL